MSRTLADLAREAEANPVRWLVPSTLIEGGIHVIHGKEESYKTALVMQLLEVLNVGGRFLAWDIAGGLRVGLAELEMTERIFGKRASDFLRTAKPKPEIAILSETERGRIINGESAKARVDTLADWAKAERLDVIAIDSAAKLFPPAANIGSQPVVSDLFSQLQGAGATVALIAHPRKRSQMGDGPRDGGGNDEIAGSGRFAQDPDIVLEVDRPDKRAPKTILSWGKNRLEDKPSNVELFFDRVALRLFPLHPFLHLLPASREQLLELAEKRFGWGRTHTDNWISSVKMLEDEDGKRVIEESRDNRKAVFQLAPGVSLAKLVEYSTRITCDTGAGGKMLPVE